MRLPKAKNPNTANQLAKCSARRVLELTTPSCPGGPGISIEISPYPMYPHWPKRPGDTFFRVVPVVLSLRAVFMLLSLMGRKEAFEHC
jgi:hypothetical protein